MLKVAKTAQDMCLHRAKYCPEGYAILFTKKNMAKEFQQLNKNGTIFDLGFVGDPATIK